MDKEVACVIVFCIALANAGLIPVPAAKILEGPSTRTKVIGPDGSIIDAYAPGGKIILDENAGPLLQPAPVVLAQAAILEPWKLQLAEPIAANSIEVATAGDSVSIEASKVARVSDDGQRVFLHPGTPARLETRDFVPITEETDETVAPTTELPGTTDYVESTSLDLSGTYVPDKFEQLFDDGSYRPEHY